LLGQAFTLAVRQKPGHMETKSRKY